MDPKTLLRRAAQRVAPATVKRYEMLRYVEGFVAPLTPVDESKPGSVATQARELPGIDMREAEQVARVEQWTKYADIFELLRKDPLINTWYSNEPRLHNTYYPTPDAEAYAAMIGDERPARIVEVGGGFSTLIARKTIDHLGLACELVVIDPEPRTEVASAADKLVRGRVEDAAADLVTGDPATLFFIDSSHVTRIGGDIPYLFGQVVPSLPAGALVHVHDIFTPYDYPAGASRYFWTEQYVVEALLSDSPRYTVELATHFLSHRRPDVVQQAISPTVGSDPLHYGAALWFSVH